MIMTVINLRVIAIDTVTMLKAPLQRPNKITTMDVKVLHVHKKLEENKRPPAEGNHGPCLLQERDCGNEGQRLCEKVNLLKGTIKKRTF